MKLRIEKWNTTEVLLLVTVLALQNFACLVPREAYILPGLMKFSDIGTVLGILFFLWGFLGISGGKRVRCGFGGWVVAFLGMQVLSGVMGSLHFGQPLSYGIRPLRNLMVCFALYFPVTRALRLGVVRRKNLMTILFWVGTLELVLYTLQYLLVGRIAFLQTDLSEVRFGSARLRLPYLLPMILGLFCYDRFLRGGSAAWNLGYLVWSVFLLMGICKHRAPGLILLGTLAFGFLLWKKRPCVKLLAGALAAILALAVLLPSPLVQSAWEALKGGLGDSLVIRKQGQMYYLERLKDSWLFGFGFPNQNWEPAILAAGFDRNYFLVDNGLVGFAYIYGGTGLVWLLSLFLQALRKSWGLYRSRGICVYLLYFLFETGNLYIGMHWYYSCFLPFVMMLILLEEEWRS